MQVLGSNDNGSEMIGLLLLKDHLKEK